MFRKLSSLVVFVAVFTLILGATEAQARGRAFRSRGNSGRVLITRSYGNYGSYRGNVYPGFGFRGGYGNYGYGPRGGVSIGIGIGIGSRGYGNYGRVGGFF